jgi:hypothetical protein
VFEHKLNLPNELLSVVGPRYDAISAGIMFPYAEIEGAAAAKPPAPPAKGGSKAKKY